MAKDFKGQDISFPILSSLLTQSDSTSLSYIWNLVLVVLVAFRGNEGMVEYPLREAGIREDERTHGMLN